MSTIQKALVFIVLVLAVLAAAVSLVLFAQRTNWKAESDKLTGEVKDARTQLEMTVKNAEATGAADNAKILELETRRATLSADLKDTQSTLENERAVRGVQEQLASELKAKIEIIQQNMSALDQRTVELRQAKEAAEMKLEEVKSAAQNAEEQLVIAKRKNKDFTSKVDSLTDQLTVRNDEIKTLKQRIDILSVYAGPIGEVAGPATRKPVFGKVTGMAKSGAVVYISIGKDDGLDDGTVLLVCKDDGTYVATARVYDVGADKAAARVVQPVVGTIMEGDNVINR